MNTAQRLLSNTALAFAANVLAKAGNALLFIIIGRWLGPTESGMFSLGTTYFTFVVGLSAFGLHEIMVRDLAPRREESHRYLVNFLALRLLVTLLSYGLLVLGLWLFLPYSTETTRVVLIISLAAIPEAAFIIFQSLFEAHERLGVLVAAALVSTALKIGAGVWLLAGGATSVDMVWVVPVASAAGLLVFLPATARLLRQSAQVTLARLDPTFMRDKLAYVPSFFFLHALILLDYQADALIISLMLGESALGYYAAAQTILLAFNLMPPAIRAALYPLMSRYHQNAPEKLSLVYEKVSHYLAALVLPLAAGLTILAEPVIGLIFGPDFGPAVPILRITIWVVVFLFLVEPHARIMLVNNRQREAARITAVTTGLNIALNLILIPVLGIIAAAIARLASSLALYLGYYAYSYTRLVPSKQPFSPSVVLATAIMSAAVWPLRELILPVPILAGIIVYAIAARLLGVVPAQDIALWREISERKA